MHFISSFTPPGEHSEPDLWFIFQKDKLLVTNTGQAVEIPKMPNIRSIGMVPVSQQYLGTLDRVRCYACITDNVHSNVPDGMMFMPLRSLIGLVPDDIFWTAARASLIMYWDRTSSFCGKCGQPAKLSGTERAKVCTACGFTTYPRISPAVIVAVIKDGHILLGSSKRFPQSFYSVLAGFVEPGETFEQCIKREIKEEAGIDVKNIRYFASQPWPFPDSMMVGFTAEYAGGDICADGEEVIDVQWFSADNLPQIPANKTIIARRLIDWFVDNYKLTRS
jgi:NAD+ diphosphatase